MDFEEADWLAFLDKGPEVLGLESHAAAGREFRCLQGLISCRGLEGGETEASPPGV
jgi:hypothetical protein